jgi:hypothetical protein
MVFLTGSSEKIFTSLPLDCIASRSSTLAAAATGSYFAAPDHFTKTNLLLPSARRICPWPEHAVETIPHALGRKLAL